MVVRPSATGVIFAPRVAFSPGLSQTWTEWSPAKVSRSLPDRVWKSGETGQRLAEALLGLVRQADHGGGRGGSDAAGGSGGMGMPTLTDEGPTVVPGCRLAAPTRLCQLPGFEGGAH